MITMYITLRHSIPCMAVGYGNRRSRLAIPYRCMSVSLCVYGLEVDLTKNFGPHFASAQRSPVLHYRNNPLDIIYNVTNLYCTAIACIPYSHGRTAICFFPRFPLLFPSQIYFLAQHERTLQRLIQSCPAMDRG